MAGCAEFVIAAVRDSGLAGAGLAMFGMSMGDVKTGHLDFDMDAKLSRILNSVGHESLGDRVCGRC